MNWGFILPTAGIFVFCGTMTTLLVRSVLYPEESRLSEVSPAALFELFASRSEGADMDVYEGPAITGRARLTPLSGPANPNRRIDSLRLAINGTLLLRGPFARYGQLNLGSRLTVSSTGEVSNYDISLRLLKAEPSIELRIVQNDGQPWPAITLTQGSATLFRSDSGAKPDAATQSLLDLMQSASGITADLAAPSREPATISARGGRITVANRSVDGYIVSLSHPSQPAAFRIYLASTGELLRIATPAGFDLLSDDLRPVGIAVPTFESPAATRRP
jgi:hypothetical protein